jgi:hypothetical protein
MERCQVPSPGLAERSNLFETSVMSLASPGMSEVYPFPSSFPAGEVPPGVLGVSYRVDLAVAAPFLINEDERNAVLLSILEG